MPASVCISLSQPGSLKYGSSTIINDWIDTKTCRKVDVSLFQLSPFCPDQVPSKDKQTLPQLYKLGLNLTVPPPVVNSNTLGGELG